VRVTHRLALYLSNAFSPNADGINDHWIPIPGGGKTYMIDYLRIYDRWGNLLHEASGPAGSVGWDGYGGGKLLDPGVYVYDLLVRLPDGRVVHLSGEMHLIR
jgi:gliding motility-associated-like protein